MCNPKVKLLLKEIKRPTLDNPEEKISINKAFKSNDFKFSVLPMTKKPAIPDDPNKKDPGIEKER